MRTDSQLSLEYLPPEGKNFHCLKGQWHIAIRVCLCWEERERERWEWVSRKYTCTDYSLVQFHTTPVADCQPKTLPMVMTTLHPVTADLTTTVGALEIVQKNPLSLLLPHNHSTIESDDSLIAYTRIHSSYLTTKEKERALVVHLKVVKTQEMMLHQQQVISRSTQEKVSRYHRETQH